MSMAIIGAGAFGTALAVALSGNDPLTLWGRDITWRRENPRLPGVLLPPAVTPTARLDDVRGADILVLALPAQIIGAFLAEHATMLNGKTLVNTAKGIDLIRLIGPSAMMAEACPASPAAVLTGPSFAADIARGLPTALTLACHDDSKGEELQHLLSTPVLRVYRTTDVIGAELGGALKNVIAIAVGAVAGAGLGDSARAAIITRGFAEMTRLAVHLGARAETLTGLSGLGDLTLTCNSTQSRNFRFGLSLGNGTAFDTATTVEGVATARAVTALWGRLSADMPIAEMVTHLANGDISVENAMELLMSRPLKEE